MAGPFGVVGKYFGSAASQTAAFAGGLAISPTLLPILQELENEAWSVHPDKPPSAAALALGVAQGQVDPGKAAHWATETGYGAEAFAALVDIANTGPPLGQALSALRRGIWTPAQYRVALNRQGIEPEWFDGLIALRDERLDPAVVAVAIQRGIIRAPFELPVPPPTSGGVVPSFPVSDIDALAEVAAAGIDRSRLFVQTAIVGNPASPQQAASAFFRGLIERTDFDRAIAEGNTRTEWGETILEESRSILTPHEYVEARLRGWIDDGQLHEGAGKHGMTAADTDLLAQLSGRPLSFRQVFIGLARGGKYDGPTTGIDPAFLKQLQESNIRPEWYSLAWAQRYSYPSAFVLRALVQDGDITEAEGEQILVFEGWDPALAHTVAAKWAGGSGSGSKEATAANLRAEYEGLFIDRPTLLEGLGHLGYTPHDAEMMADLGDAARVKKWRDEYVTAVEKAFLAHNLTADQARADLIEQGIAAEAADNAIRLWTLRQAVERKTLTPAQIAARFNRQTLTQAQALAELEDHGYTPADAAALLGIAAPVLTVPQILAAYKAGEITRDQALAQLAGEGFTAAQGVELVDTAVPPAAS